MKKTIALTALAAASSAVCAQSSSLTVYGILDAGVSQVSGLKGGTRKDVISGIMDGSRLGFKGNEDLGGGYRAVFTLEHRLELDTGDIKNRPFSGTQLPDRFSDPTLMGLSGLTAQITGALTPALGAPVAAATAAGAVRGAVTNVGLGIANLGFGVNVPGKFWDRQAYVGLVTPFGGFLAGRQYTPAFEVSAAFDTLGTQSALSMGQVATFPASMDLRFDNTVAYRIQLGGLSASVMAAPRESSTTNGHFLGGMAMYRTDAWSVGLGYNSKENELGEKSLTTTVLGASMGLGPGTAYVAYMDAQDDHPSALSGVPALVTSGAGALGATLASALGNGVGAAFVNAFKQDAQVTHVGYKLTKGPNVVYVAYSALNDKLHDADTTSYGVAYSYSLSKRTAINAVAVHFDNKGLGQAAPGQAGFLGGVTATAATDSNSFAVGIRHSF
jgi:predicted porin